MKFLTYFAWMPDPLQFAHRAKTAVQDATLTFFNYIYRHLEGSSMQRLLFVDFSSVFNTVQPHLLVQKLGQWYVGWIRERVNVELSIPSVTSTDSPLGCVLSPWLCVMYTNDCRKFADDTVKESLLNRDECPHGPVVDYFSSWCQESIFIFRSVWG